MEKNSKKEKGQKKQTPTEKRAYQKPKLVSHGKLTMITGLTGDPGGADF